MEKHNTVEVEKRAKECYDLRYNQEIPITQLKWVTYCREKYNDRSEQTYCTYWSKAKDIHDSAWRERLNSLLGPATEKLAEHLLGPDGRLSDAAIAKVFQYTGNNIEKIDASVSAEIVIKFGEE